MSRLLTKPNLYGFKGGKKSFLFNCGIVGSHGMMWEKQIHDYASEKQILNL
jgi:hypothetical protein